MMFRAVWRVMKLGTEVGWMTLRHANFSTWQHRVKKVGGLTEDHLTDLNETKSGRTD